MTSVTLDIQSLTNVFLSEDMMTPTDSFYESQAQRKQAQVAEADIGIRPSAQDSLSQPLALVRHGLCLRSTPDYSLCTHKMRECFRHVESGRRVTGYPQKEVESPVGETLYLFSVFGLITELIGSSTRISTDILVLHGSGKRRCARHLRYDFSVTTTKNEARHA